MEFSLEEIVEIENLIIMKILMYDGILDKVSMSAPIHKDIINHQAKLHLLRNKIGDYKNDIG